MSTEQDRVVEQIQNAEEQISRRTDLRERIEIAFDEMQRATIPQIEEALHHQVSQNTIRKQIEWMEYKNDAKKVGQQQKTGKGNRATVYKYTGD
jgi:dTDP-4-amino-4,6-dideoxygalactose transaminase